MAIEQPISTDPLNAPDHSLQHRIVASDASAPVKSLTIDANGDIGGTCFKNTNPTNLLSNGDFEAWSAGTSSAPDGWALLGSGGAVAREATIIKLGTYSSAITRNGTDCFIYNSSAFSAPILEKGDYWKGRIVTFGCWVYATVADRARIAGWSTADAGDKTFSSYHTGDSTWQWLTVTKTIDATESFDRVAILLQVDTGDTTAYFDGAMLVEGSSAFAFSDKPAGEGVWADYFATSTITGWAASPTGTIFTNKIGNMVFVNYDLAGTSNSASTTFTVPYTAASGCNPVARVGYAKDNNVVMPDANLVMAASGSTVTVYKDVPGTAWTTSGAKWASGQFFYKAAN